MKHRKGFILLTLLIFPLFLFANAGTPLMWANAFYLFIGNAIIGTVEGLISSFFSLKSKKKSILFFILLNYVSMVSGLLVVIPAEAFGFEMMGVTIENAKLFMYASFSFFYLATIFVEFPFILGFFWKENNKLRKSLKTTLLVNTVSYALIFPLYWLASSATMVNDLEVVSPREIGLPKGYELYYIDENGADVVKSSLNGKSRELIRKIEDVAKSDSIKAIENKNQKIDLYISNGKRLIFENVSGIAPKKDDKKHKQFGELTEHGSWEYSTGWWGAAEGVKGHDDDGRFFRYTLDTPFLSWTPRNGTHVEKDLLIFQLNGHQIVALRHEKKQIALIARGFGPIVVKKLNESEKPVDGEE